ncbi:hypothetical protein DFQ29_001168 [Apophysomyces sp. BC1021]|nr:hypothetical protein DFQ29_001168 [Apophysomyces sp. BC1021]
MKRRALINLLIVTLASFRKAYTQQTECHNYKNDFTKSTAGWIAQGIDIDTYALTPTGIKMKLMPPRQYVRLHDENHMPYNRFEGRGPTFNSSTYLQYGRVSATVKSARVGGAVTAIVLIGDGNDEIDIELLGGNPNELLGQLMGRLCERVQIGLWDGSKDSGTAEWARGPIDWVRNSVVSAYIKAVEIDCNPEYNNITGIVTETGEIKPYKPSPVKESTAQNILPSYSLLLTSGIVIILMNYYHIAHT